MTKRVAIGLLTLLGVLAGGSPGLAQVHYRARIRIADPDEQRVWVELTLTGIPTDLARLELFFAENHSYVTLEPRFKEPPSLRLVPQSPDSPAGAAPAGARLTQGAQFAWTLEPAGQTEVLIRYGIRLDHRRDERVRGRDEYE